MPGETHQVDYDGDSVSASFQALRARYDVEAARDATLADRDIDGRVDRAPWSEMDPSLTDQVMPDAVSMAAILGSGGRGGY
jgi:hypothetical protein